MEDMFARIRKLENEIESLPVGYISKKTINGKVRRYQQWSESGKKKSKYLGDATADEMQVLIERRRELQKEVKRLKALLPKKSNTKKEESNFKFKTHVLIGEELRKSTLLAEGLRKRECYAALEQYIRQKPTGKVFILYGLRRTGKTTMIRQLIHAMSSNEFNRTAFIQVRAEDTLGDLNADLKWLSANHYRNVFLDEVTLAEDFIEGAALFSDIYAASGMKIVLSGTDSLGFLFSESAELYDRCVLLHTTWIPYREFEQVLGIYGIDEYIRYGGTMSLSGTHYNEASTFSSKASTDEYIDSAIAKNIQHSLKFYQYGDHFRHLGELFERNELTSAINRVVEDINHRFTVGVLTDDFISHDLGISKKNLRKDRQNPTDVLDRIDLSSFTEGLRQALDILNRAEQSVTITDIHRAEIKEYLDLLDLTVDIPTEFLPVRNDRLYRTVIAQPGMRYAQADALVRQLMLDVVFQNISIVDRAAIIDRIMNEIRGRMMEEIVLLETRMAYPQKNVFRLQFQIGEFDMVVADPKSLSCEIYELKHSRELVPEQYRFLVEPEKCKATEFRYGTITKKCVIYRGETTVDGEISYWNVEEYLKQLPCGR